MLKRTWTLLVTFGLALLLNVINPHYIPAQKLFAVPVDLQVPLAPTPVKADGKIHLLYELHVTNFRSRNLEVTRVEVLADDENTPLASYQDVELSNRLGRPGATADLADSRAHYVGDNRWQLRDS
jgi:hypothetical protein